MNDKDKKIESVYNLSLDDRLDHDIKEKISFLIRENQEKQLLIDELKLSEKAYNTILSKYDKLEQLIKLLEDKIMEKNCNNCKNVLLEIIHDFKKKKKPKNFVNLKKVWNHFITE